MSLRRIFGKLSTHAQLFPAHSASTPCQRHNPPAMEDPNAPAEPQPVKEYQPRFGRLLLVCALSVIFCGLLVWFASTYLTDCCGP